jgi:S-(hydroxymethyl)glutathione dehydrogenase/alcohol dehydrogenase
MSITTRAAICFELGTPWQIEEIELDPPKAGEVLARMGGSGLCHSDEHIVTGDLPWPLPMIGGHEGAAVIEEVGPGVMSVAPGDRVIFGFIPACGRCPSCSSGHQNLCDLGMYMGAGMQVSDHTARHHRNGQDLNLMCMLGTFAERTVTNEANCIKIGDDIPLDVACLLGCGVGTGWGAAVNTGEVAAGDTVVVVGVGGIGINAVQGAALAGAERILAIDPVEFKRQKALEFGATHTAADWDSGFDLLQELTWGRLANVVINTKGLGEGADIAAALRLAGKRGKVVVTNLHNAAEATVAMSALDLVLMEKQVRGSLFGSSNPRADIPRMLDLYRNGKLKLDELATHRYKLEEVNQGYDDMRAGRSLRGVITF